MTGRMSLVHHQISCDTTLSTDNYSCEERLDNWFGCRSPSFVYPLWRLVALDSIADHAVHALISTFLFVIFVQSWTLISVSIGLSFGYLLSCLFLCSAGCMPAVCSFCSVSQLYLLSCVCLALLALLLFLLVLCPSRFPSRCCFHSVCCTSCLTDASFTVPGLFAFTLPC